MRTVTTNIYKYSELSETAQRKAFKDYVDSNKYDFLSEYLHECATDKLEISGYKADNLKVYYSLSYCQGDGVCFTGDLTTQDNLKIKITHNFHHYHYNSCTYSFYSPDGETIDDNEAIIGELKEIMRELSKDGYLYIDHNNSEETFKEICDSNEYEFTADGSLFHGVTQ